MPPQLLATKLNIPPQPANLVHRARLMQQIDAGLQRKLTLVTAPAGFGKTTVLSDWSVSVKECLPAAWLTLHDRDNDPHRFWQYVCAALGQLGLRGNDHFRSFDAAMMLDETLTALIDGIAADIPCDFALILDDYHSITAPAIHAAVAFLLEQCPAHMHLIIASRATPPLPIGTLRARDQLVEVRANDLRFTLDEAAVFLNQAMHLDLSHDLVASLDERTEGWIAGLQLAALSMRHRRDAAEFIRLFAGTHHYIVDYLAEQVLGQQPPAMQQFLLETSILDRLTGSLCEAVTGQACGQDTLHRLERANLFLVPLDDDQLWYRYHHLFADFLQARLRQAEPQRWPELHRCAAVWYEQNGYMEDAVHHALAANDFETAVRLIRQVAEALWNRSDVRTLYEWLTSLPADRVNHHRDLRIFTMWVYALTGELARVDELLQSADADGCTADADLSDEQQQAKDEMGLAAADIMRAFVMRFRRTPADAIVYAQRALDRTPADNIYQRCQVMLLMGHAQMLAGDADGANRTLLETMTASQAINFNSVYLSAINYLGQLRVWQGRLHQAAAIFQEARLWIEVQHERQLSGIERVGLGDVKREWNELDEAADLIDEGVKLAEAGGDFVFVRDAYLARARLDWAHGDLDRAMSDIQRARQAARGSSTWHIDARCAHLQVARGNLAAAEHWAQQSGLAVDDDLCAVDEYPHVVLARVLLAQGRASEAIRLLGRLLGAAQAGGRSGCVIEMLILCALAHQANGEMPHAIAPLARAMALAEPEGYVRVFIDEGAPLTALLSHATHAKLNGQAGYARKLLTIFDGQKTTGTNTAFAGSVLSERELEIVQLIAAGRTYQSIAQELIIALSTVQSHIKNIYSKLDAHSGLEAVARARQLTLLR
jgi:LuxR family maltose regulon positive regulatory protein